MRSVKAPSPARYAYVQKEVFTRDVMIEKGGVMSGQAISMPSELKDHIDERGFAEIQSSLKGRFNIALEEYMEETTELLKELNAALDEGEHTEIARHAHIIMSESRAIGLSALAEAAAALEEMADIAGDTQFSYGDILLLTEQLEENYAIVEPYLQDVVTSYS